MKYEILTTYEVEEMTCGEAIKILEKSGGDIHCLHAFIDPNYPNDVAEFHDSWDWIQAGSPNKKILLVIDEISSVGRAYKYE